MKVQITTADSGFPSDINVNRNPDCIYYSNQRVCISPEAQWSYAKDNDGLCEHSALTVAELIECLPGVYTRTLKTSVDERGTDDMDKCVDFGATKRFAVVAAYLNAWNDFVKEHLHDHDGAGTGFPKYYDVRYGKYVVGKELTAFRKEYPAVRSMFDELPDNRLVKVQFFFCVEDENKPARITSWYEMDNADGFSFEVIRKEV